MEYRELLLTYNREDCQALKRLADELSRIKHSANNLSEVDFANKPKRHATQVGQQLHSQFRAILTFAYELFGDLLYIFGYPDVRK